jgi:hypothetical protein
MISAGETEVLGENLPSATLSTTNPTWIDPGANPGLRDERPVTNRLSHGTACTQNYLYLLESYTKTQWKKKHECIAYLTVHTRGAHTFIFFHICDSSNLCFQESQGIFLLPLVSSNLWDLQLARIQPSLLEME